MRPNLIDDFLSLSRFEARRQADMLLAPVVREASPSIVADALVEFAENLPDEFSPNDLFSSLGWDFSELVSGFSSGDLDRLEQALEEVRAERSLFAQQRLLAVVK